MDGNSIIHDNLERKILILYALRRLPCEVDGSFLFELCNSIDTIDYFSFNQCCYELASAGLCHDDEGYYSISTKGSENVESVETGLPFSVRLKADEAIEGASDVLKRFSLVKSEYTECVDGWNVSMSLNDAAGRLISMDVVCADKTDAIKIRNNFRANAEKYYNTIIGMLTE